jgi:hypothetical protein
VLVAIVFAAVLAAYLPVWHAGFIWDDDSHVTANPSIVGSLGLARIWTSPAANYFPLTTSTFWVIHALWDLNPLPYHVVDVLFHAACAVLLWLVLRRLRVRGAWLGAMLWALHPVQVESAAWIAETKNTQSGIFYLLAIWCFLRWVEAEPPRDHGRSYWAYALAWVCAVLAILSKASTVMLPVVLGLCWWWTRDRWRYAHFREAVRMNPEYADAQNNLGRALLQLGRPREAVRHFQEALRINPGFAPAREGLDFARQQLGPWGLRASEAD